MTPITPSAPVVGGQAVVFAKGQPEYLPLPAIVSPEGYVLTEWQLTEDERARLLSGEAIRLFIWTFGQALQPVMLEVTSEHGA
jgi:hypothetical protein